MLKLFRGDFVNNFKQFKQSVNEIEMTNKIVQMLKILDLEKVDEGLKGILILQYLKQNID